jgi:hypothetical protein
MHNETTCRDRTPTAYPSLTSAIDALLHRQHQFRRARRFVVLVMLPAVGEYRSASTVSAPRILTGNLVDFLQDAQRAQLTFSCRSASPPDTSSRAAKREGIDLSSSFWEFEQV